MCGQEFSVGESVAQSLARFFPIIGMIVLQTLGIGLGALLFVIPGLILLTLWYVALPACVIEQLGSAASFRSSSDLTKSNRWRVFRIAIMV